MFDLKSIVNEFDIQGFNSIYCFEFGKSFTHPPEKHSFWEMVYVDYGEILVFSDDNSYTLSQGQLFFHEPNELHSHISDNKVPNNMLVVNFSINSKNMKFFSKKIFDADKVVKTLLSLFITEAKNALGGSVPSEYTNKNALDFSRAQFGSLQLLSCYFSELLIYLSRTNSGFNNKIVPTEASRAIAKSSVCELVIEYMQQNIYSALSLNDVCQHLTIGKSHLSHIFKLNTGKSVMEYYNDLKISEAKKLLRTEKHTISQISDMLGYSCIHSFSRAFKKNVGFSPTSYKKKIV